MTENPSQSSPFDHVASDYDVVRPKYPDALFERLMAATQLNASSRALEIGPGTGQATMGLAPYGLDILAIELGIEMSRIARANFESVPNVEVRTADFEDVDLPAQGFDLVYCATALHWISEAKRFQKPFELLKSGGFLALINTHHVSDESGDAFYKASQAIYQKHGAGQRNAKGHPRVSELGPVEVDARLFEPADFACYPVQRKISAEDMAKLVGTFSPTFALSPSQKSAFLSDMAELIERDFGGAITLHTAVSLTLSRRRD